ncbi:uncharacterized protein EV154DRAFT_492453 [Mucor mucedo]|uniref:uncharacterized protein n=1 Tax=Mucor mucedo TaxID=29922 RepID=UPI00221F8546|nr:uncharacterized protein EV154DRAFT_492453 [Mucor mucedo]KAI7896485.1 hypothetical protein EV154DRAFT_492453 [Mucor mucedo]
MDAIWKDLSDWQKDINKKDEALLRNKPVHNKTLPAIRQTTELVLDNLKPVGLDSLKKSAPVKSTSNNKVTAEAEKAKGNEYFGKKDFKNAIVYYGKAIDLDPTVPVYFVNRAMAYLKLNKFLEAEKDCTRGIQLAPRNVKAFWRRGIALRELGRFNEAKRDFEMGLAIEPNNKSILDELKNLPKINQQTGKEKRRLSINVIDASYSEPKLVDQVPSVLNTKPVNKSVKSAPIQKSKIAELPSKIIHTPSAPTQPTQPAPAPASLAPPVLMQVPTKITSPLKCPRTNFEFERDWKTYKSRGDDILYQYLQCIPPSSYATLFKTSLESDQFEKMVDLMVAQNMPPKDAFDVLEGLSLVKRIDMLVMFLSKHHQQAISGLFETIKANNSVPTDKLTKVAKVYGVRI